VILDELTTITSTPGLLKSFTQSVRSPVSKPGFRTGCGHVGCAVTVLVAVTVTVDIDTDVIVVCVAGGIVGHVCDVDVELELGEL